jgi:hypothetical protein
VKVKLPEYPPDGRNQLQASENEFMTSAHQDGCSQAMHKMFVTARRHCEKLLLSSQAKRNSITGLDRP